MRKNGKQIIALALALGVAATGMTGLEALVAEGEAEASIVDTSGKGTMDMTIEGTIKATQISATVFLKAALNVNPGKSGTAARKPSESKVDAEIITSVNDCTITNNSIALVWVYISKIEIKTGSTVDTTPGKDISFVGTASVLQDAVDNNNVMIVMKKDGQFTTLPMLNAVEGDGKNSWLTTGFSDNYYMNNDGGNETDIKGKLETVGAAENVNIMGPKMCVLTMGTWQDDNKFAVTPTFAVSIAVLTT